MPTIKIGIDQWAVTLKNAGTNLYTAGLSGCVALVLTNESQIGLTHVISDAGNNWQSYEPKLDEMVSSMNNKVKAYLMTSENLNRPPLSLLEDYLKKNVSSSRSCRMTRASSSTRTDRCKGTVACRGIRS